MVKGKGALVKMEKDSKGAIVKVKIIITIGVNRDTSGIRKGQLTRDEEGHLLKWTKRISQG